MKKRDFLTEQSRSLKHGKSRTKDCLLWSRIGTIIFRRQIHGATKEPKHLHAEGAHGNSAEIP